MQKLLQQLLLSQCYVAADAGLCSAGPRAGGQGQSHADPAGSTSSVKSPWLTPHYLNSDISPEEQEKPLEMYSSISFPKAIVSHNPKLSFSGVQSSG